MNQTSRSEQKAVAFIGPLQPPVHGLSTIHAAMIDLIGRHGATISVFDTTPHGLIHIFRELLRFIIWLMDNPKRPVYLSVSGGPRQFLESTYVLLGNLLGRRNLFLHHHSFSYLGKTPLHSRILLGLARSSRHIVLCNCMGKLLALRYNILPSRIDDISNIAIISEVPMPKFARSSESDELPIVGYISNISREKGIFIFIEIVKRMYDQGLISGALIAGPIEPHLQPVFREATKSLTFVKYRGAVYNAEKEKFFNEIDVLLFPTLYRNEAEPLILLEAASYGVPSCALVRGCIREMLPNSILRSAESIHELEEEMRSICGSLRLHYLNRNRLRNQIRETFNDSRIIWKQKLVLLASEVVS